MTPARATEIMQQARALATCGPWSDQISKVITPEERAEVVQLWETMPGNSCFVDALNRIANLRQISRAEYDKLHSDFRGIWTTEREDWDRWPKVRGAYMGKRTMLDYDQGTVLLIEGLHFAIVDTPA